MAKRTTVKAIALGYRDVGTSGDYTPLMGVLKGLTVAQDEPDSTEIEAEFYDSPFDIFYDGNPVTMSFELANYDLAELEDLFGGAYDDTNDEYEAASNAFTSEHEWKLDFGRGNASLVIYKGLTIGTLKKDADGALNYSVTITALIYNDGENDHMYKIVGSSGDTPSPTPPTETLYYKLLEGSTTPYVVNTDGRAIYNSQGMGFHYLDGVITLDNISSAPIPKKQYDFTFNTSAETQEISIDGVTYTFIKSGGSNYTISPSINEFQS